METKISVIIPAYNAACFLADCLDSVLYQSMHEIEIIIVDDGSTDDTPAICDRYAGMDSRVRVTHKENSGVSEARNTGISMSSGEYIWFVDADDIIMPGACAELYSLSRTSGADIVIFDYSRIREGADAGTFHSVFTPGLYNDDRIINDLLSRFIGFSNDGIHRWLCRKPDGLYVENPALWRTFLRGGLIRDNNLRFDPALRVGEDTVFISLCLSYANLAFITHSVLYRQTLHSESTVSRYERDPEAKLVNKLELLSARNELTDDVCERRGIDISPFWQGTVVMSYMELCFMFAQRSAAAGFRARYAGFLRYAGDRHVILSTTSYPMLSRAGVRNIPFRLMKKRRHCVLFLCAAILSLTPYRFIRG